MTKKHNSIAAIIVLYQPPESLPALLAAIRPQVQEIIMVDNGENSPVDAVHWIKNPENNLAKAQNLGVAKARELGCSHVLLLDDDSLPAEDMVAKLLATAKKQNKQGGKKVAIAAPYLEEEALGKPPLYIQPKGRFSFHRIGFDEKTPILNNLYYVAASGSLIALEIFDHIGDFKEDFGIYFVDTEFCLRARKAGFDIIAVRDAKMQHRFGKRTNHTLPGGRTISTTNHSPQARQIMCRNRRHLWKKYLDSDGGYVWFDILRLQSEALRVLLFEDDKTIKLSAMVSGLFGWE